MEKKESNIERIYKKEDKQERCIFFYKTEGRPVANIDPRDSKKSVIEFERPSQAMFLVGGETTVSGDDINVAMGVITVLKDVKIWNNLVMGLKNISDGKVEMGVRVPCESFDYYSFYVCGFNTKEELIGVIQNCYPMWQKKLDNLREKISPKYVDEGDSHGAADTAGGD